MPLLDHVRSAARRAALTNEPVRYLARSAARRPVVGAYSLRGSDVRFHVRHRSPDVGTVAQAAAGEAPYVLPVRAAALLDGLGRAPRVADLGANIGLFSAFALRRWPDATVLAYEPEPGNAGLIRRSIAANPGRRWELVAACAGTSAGEATFVVGDFATSHIAEPPEAATAATARVPVEDVFPRLRDVDLLKVDIEGAEWGLLDDPRFAELPARVVAFEFHARNAPGPDPAAEARRRLAAAGYDTEAGELLAPPGHGMLWAYRRDAPPPSRAFLAPEERRRVELTTAVRDADPIPKVPEAGEVRDLDGTRVQVMHNGVVVEEGCYYGAWMTEVIRRLRGHHEPQEEAVFHALVERLREDGGAPAMLELGSFWAYYSLWLARAIPGARCWLVEPDPRNLATGERNFRLNGETGRFIHAVAGPRHGRSVVVRTESDGAPRPVRAVTVDGLMAEEGVERLDLVLCDVQGAELDVLRGAGRAIRDRRIRFLVVSTHHHAISGDPLTHQRCLAWLRGAGAHIVAEHSVFESCSGDGLIAASLDPRDADLHVDVTTVRARDSLFGEPEWELARALRGRLAARRALTGAATRLRRARDRVTGA